MTSSGNRQDELNLVLWLATLAGKMELSCPLGIQALSRKKNLSCFCVYPTYFKMLYSPSLFGQDGWILASLFFCVFMDHYFVLVHKHAKKKKNLANIQPSWPHTWSIANISKPHMIDLKRSLLSAKMLHTHPKVSQKILQGQGFGGGGRESLLVFSGKIQYIFVQPQSWLLYINSGISLTFFSARGKLALTGGEKYLRRQNNCPYSWSICQVSFP